MTTGQKRRGDELLPTMGDVARLAGVSVMTVSRVIRGKDRVSEGTQRNVARAVAALRYSPNTWARTLTGARPLCIGLFCDHSSGSLSSEFLIGLISQSALNNVRLVLAKSKHDHVEMQSRHLAGQSLDGILMASPLCDGQAVLDFASKFHIPTVVVGCGWPDERTGAIYVDDYEGAYRMTRHLVYLGHRRIGFVAGPSERLASSRRLAGHRAAIEEYGADRSEQLIVPGMLTYHSGLDAADYLLELSDRPTAIFASNDDMAAAAIAVALRRGIDVPGDLTVVGFDGTPIATTIWPELTTLRQPVTDMGRAAVQILMRRARALREGVHLQPERVRMDFELVRRQSDAIPRRVTRA